ncbi:MAG: flavodoxin family protein [Methanocella sp.]|jgi:flavodoxin
MKPIVVYFSRTGNTKRLAQAIAEATNAPIYDTAQADPEKIAQYDLFIFGCPVEGASPAKEAAEYIAALPAASSKKAILFTTYRLFGNERTMKAIEKDLAAKGYETLLKVSKKGMKPEEPADFSKVLSEVNQTLQKI